MLHMMNRKRRIVLVTYFLSMAAASIYVPYAIHWPAGNEVSQGYHLITKSTERDLVSLPPGEINPNDISATKDGPTVCQTDPKTEGCTPQYKIHKWYAVVDYVRLVIEYIAITAIFMAIFATL